MFAITTKFEINAIGDRLNPSDASNFAVYNKCPAIVVHPQHVAEAMALKSAYNGLYKVITAIDFPHGRNFGLDKFKNYSSDFTSCDGLDIMLSEGRTQMESMNEMRAIQQFFRSISPIMEIRWTLGSTFRSKEVLGDLLNSMKTITPNFIRLDPTLYSPSWDEEKTKEMIKFVLEKFTCPIKIGPNVSYELIKNIEEDFGRKNFRYDVDVEQARSVVKKVKEEIEAEKHQRIKEDQAQREAHNAEKKEAEDLEKSLEEALQESLNE